MYYSQDKHGQNTRAAATDDLAAPGGPQNGDRFMFQNSYAQRTEAELFTIFGPAFAKEVFTLESGRWVGPVQSGYGWHAVFVERKAPASIPSFEEIEPDVKAAYLHARRAEFRQEAYRVMREKYKIVLPKFDTPSSAPDAVVQGLSDAKN